MKRTLILAASAAAAILSGCNKSDNQAATYEVHEAELHLSVSEDTGSTKAVDAGEYTVAETYEKQVNSVQVFVFEGESIVAYKNLGTQTSSTISTKVGPKTVWAVVNGPDLKSVKTLTELTGKAIRLEDNKKDASRGFIMSGSSSVELAAGESTCNIKVSRLVSRITLKEIKNSLPAGYGAITIERAFLANVVGNQSIGGTASPNLWYNKEGRADESPRNSSHIIDGAAYKASAEELTFVNAGSASISNGGTLAALSTKPYMFYTFPNSSTAEVNGYTAAGGGQRSVLVIVARIDGQVSYYPVVLKTGALERNKTYNVGVELTGPGSSDPNIPVVKGNINVYISVEGWVAGATYNEVI